VYIAARVLMAILELPNQCPMGNPRQFIPQPTPRRDGRGRPCKDRRAVLNGILWILRTGAPRADVPDPAILPTKPAIAGFNNGLDLEC